MTRRSIEGRPPHPAIALNGLIVACVITFVFWRWASAQGWELAWLGVIAGGIGILEAVQRLRRAHQAWRERKRIEAEIAREPDIHTTTGRFEVPRGKDGWPLP